MKILIVEPFMGGSHAAWAEGYKKHSRHGVSIISLSAHHWKWRMTGGAITLAEHFLKQPEPDIILASDMLDLCTFLALTRPASNGVPAYLYMHENQLCYPTRKKTPYDYHYAFINYNSALAADGLCFNSRFHLESFFKALPGFLKMFPKPTNMSQIQALRKKASVLEPGLDLESLDMAAPDGHDGAPVILWNHRWEYDKNPTAFYRLLCLLKDAGHHFRLVLMGGRNEQYPEVFDRIMGDFEECILYKECAPDRRSYRYWLHRSDIIPVTSEQDFFGISLLEAMYCGVYPLVPNRMAFPGHFAFKGGSQHIYNNGDALFKKTAALLTGSKDVQAIERCVQEARRHDWRTVCTKYDDLLEGLS